MTLEVRLLGAIEAYRGGERVELRGGQLRALVAYLALVPGTSRSIDGIVDALWPEAERGGAMPADPRQAVHTYASRARRALGPDSVVARDGGYALVVDPLDLDARRFESLVRSAADPGCSVKRKVELLEEGLALWRGAALDGLHDREWARPDAVRLEEMRAIAQDDRGEALLALGDALAAVPLLTAAASSSPLRERTHALLMTALHHCGRQAEALRVFQQFRHRLGTDLGLEPGDAITGLERSIASGERAVPDVASSGRVVPGYVLHERIGDGNFAVVYRGRQPSVERDVAIKVIRAELANRPEFVRRFEAEAQLVANLEHPHIVPLYDFWRAPGSAYLVMRLFPVGTLDHRISNGPLELQDVTRLVSQIGAALATAHGAGVVHRDVKPANICLDAQGNFYLGDFGIAHEAMSAPPATDSLSVGSPMHASPEQLRREPVGPTADVHGLAITVIEALSGRSPYGDARSEADLLHRQLNEPLPPLPSMPGRAAPDVVARLDSVLARAAAKDPAQRHSSVDELVADFLRAAGSVEALESNRHRQPWAPGEGVLRNPYKGLRPFDEADASDFFGRARLVDRLVERMGGGDFEGRMLTVVGPSGSGKSSVVRAGLVPRLRGGAVTGAAEWFITAMVPGAHPFEELEAALGRIATTPVGGTAESMASERRGIARAVRQLLPDDNSELLLVIDQFEELFTLCVDPQERDRFIAGLVEAVTEPLSRLRLVATLRADFFDRPLRHPELATLVERSAVAVTPLAADELESAITEPGYRAGVKFESGLVTRVVADVVDQPGALPLLQYALTELFDRHEAGVLTIEAYEALGGLTGALAQRGEQLYTNASEGEQAAIRRMFTRLVSLGEGTEDTRRRVRRPELGTGPETQSVVDRYGAARLLSFDRDPLTREQTVEVAHEALLREWPRLRLWLDDDRDGLRLQRHITTSASAWEASGRDDGELYRGGRLEAAANWVGDHPNDLNESERAFVAASEALHRSTELSRVRSARRLRRSLVAVATVAVVALVAGGLAWRQQRAATTSQRAADAAARDATEQRDVATAAATEAERHRQAAEDSSVEAEQQRQSALATAYAADTERMAAIAPTLVDTDPSLALVLAAEANSRSNDPRTQGALQRVLVAQSTLGFIRPGYLVTQAGFDTSGNIVTFGNKQIDVWDATTHRRVDSIVVPEPQYFVPGGPTVQPIAIGGDLVVWMDPDRELWAADLRTGEVERQFPTDVVGVGIDGPRRQIGVVTATGDVLIFAFGETAPRWTAAGNGIRTLGELVGPDQLNTLFGDIAGLPPAGAVVFNASGTKVYFSRSSGVRVFDTSAGTELANVQHMGSPGGGQFLVPLASDDSLVVISDTHGAVLVDTDSPDSQPVPIELAQQLPTWQTFAATGGYTFAAVDLGGRVTVFDVSGDIVLGPVSLDVGRSWAVTLAPDGRSIAVAGQTGVELLALDGSGLMHTTTSVPAGNVQALGLTDELIYSSEAPAHTPASGGTGTYWRCRPVCAVSHEIQQGGADIPFQAVNGWIPVESVESSGPDPVVWRIYDQAGGLHATGPSHQLTFVGGVFVPRSGSWIALLLVAGAWTLEVRSLPDWTLLNSQPLESSRQLVGGAEPDQLLVVDDFVGSSELLDTTTWKLTPSPMGPTDAVDARFSPDGRWLVTVSGRGDMTIRDSSTFDAVKVLSGAGAAGNGLLIPSLAVSDDSRFILSALDGRARLWDVATGEPIGDPVGVAGGPPWSSVVGGDTPKYVTLADGKMRILSFDVDRYREMACSAAGRNMTREEWDLYGPRNEAYHAPCAQWPAEYSYCAEVQSCSGVTGPSRT